MSNQAPDGIYDTFEHLLSRLGTDVLPPREQFDMQMAKKLETWFSSDEGHAFEAWATGKQDGLSQADLDRIRQTLTKLCKKAQPKEPKASSFGDYDLGVFELSGKTPKTPVPPPESDLDKDYKRFELLFSSLNGQQDAPSTRTLIPIFKIKDQNAGQEMPILPKRSDFTADDAKRINEWLAGPNGKALQEWVSGTRASLSRTEFDAINSDLAMLQARQRPLPFYLSDFKKPDYLTLLDKSPDPLGDMIKPKGSAPQFLPESALDDGMQLLRPRHLLRDIVPKKSAASSSEGKDVTPKPKSTPSSEPKPEATNEPIKPKAPSPAKPKRSDAVEPKTPPNMPSSFRKLDQMIGLEPVKQAIRVKIASARIQQERAKQGLPSGTDTLHMIFTGNPGTGKTAVARIVGEIYKEAGLLTKGQLVEMDRSVLTGEFQGDIERNTREKLQEARGGVFFLDEAYDLSPRKDGRHDIGSLAITIILKEMYDHRDSFALIAAGYADKMSDFLDSNPGLRSRCPTIIDFPDYNSDELLAIFKKMMRDWEYNLLPEAEKKLRDMVKAMYANRGKHFGNAREIESLFEKCRDRLSLRISDIAHPSRGDLMNIFPDDIPAMDELK